MNLEHEIVKKYLDIGSWKRAGIRTQEGKRAVQKVLRYHMTNCVGVNSLRTNQKRTKIFNSIKKKKRKPRSEVRTFRASHKWQRMANERRIQFGYICPITLETDSLQVHHIDSDWTNNEPENLIPLWTPIHRLTHARAEMSVFYEALDQTIFLSITESWSEKND